MLDSYLALQMVPKLDWVLDKVLVKGSVMVLEKALGKVLEIVWDAHLGSMMVHC